MDSMHNFWQLGDELRGRSRVSEDNKWSVVASKLAEQTRSKGERRNNLDLSKDSDEIRPKDYIVFQEDNKFEILNFDMLNWNSKMPNKSSFGDGMYHMNSMYQKSNGNNASNITGMKYSVNNLNKEANSNGSSYNIDNPSVSVNDKRFKTLPAAETLPRNEVLGGYIFVCNNDTMMEDLKRQLFGLPPRYRDSVRAITPGLPLFLYNYTTHQLNYFADYSSLACELLKFSNLLPVAFSFEQAASFGGSNIDPSAWEDKKCRGESRFPAQVRIRIRKLCKALEEDAFRPVLHHYDGPKFRLELSVPETLNLLDLCEQAGV
ncbi:hypothetical protein RHSIM_Rhsim08G0043000 [Rhododendron simsii]|uniref:DCD domain-containing protein n=1 Tax=Rhododendron simsii TaxID=118357 RepID=A0A834LGQ6_RHOSS|nr:hypothetical protein RHSIM_Rhsim08G0043000 [Rhododendron simsii]